MKHLALLALEQLRCPELLETRTFIDGQWIEGESRLPVLDPATSVVIVQVAHCDVKRMDKAVDAASQAFVLWRDQLRGSRTGWYSAWSRSIPPDSPAHRSRSVAGNNQAWAVRARVTAWLNTWNSNTSASAAFNPLENSHG